MFEHESTVVWQLQLWEGMKTALDSGVLGYRRIKPEKKKLYIWAQNNLSKREWEILATPFSRQVLLQLESCCTGIPMYSND